MTMITQPAAVLHTLPGSDDYVLDPRKSMPDYRREIYDLLQFLDEEQEKIEKQLSNLSSAPSIARRHEREDEDDFVVVEDINAASRKQQLISQLQQLWRTRDVLRKRARQLNIRIDSLSHGKGSGLMPNDDLLQTDVGANDGADMF